MGTRCPSGLGRHPTTSTRSSSPNLSHEGEGFLKKSLSTKPFCEKSFIKLGDHLIVIARGISDEATQRPWIYLYGARKLGNIITDATLGRGSRFLIHLCLSVFSLVKDHLTSIRCPVGTPPQRRGGKLNLSPFLLC